MTSIMQLCNAAVQTVRLWVPNSVWRSQFPSLVLHSIWYALPPNNLTNYPITHLG